MNHPLILSFDTSAAHCAVALFCGDKVLADRVQPMTKGQAEALFPMLESLLAQAGKTWRDLTAIGCGIGPGNFTGTRLSVAAARGLALSLGIPAIGVNSFDALCHGQNGPCLALIDARRNQLYAQHIGAKTQDAPGLFTRQDLIPRFKGKIDHVLGHDAETIAASLGVAPALPADPLAVAIARITAQRFGQPAPRPAPLYLKSADAAPSRDAPPVLLS